MRILLVEDEEGIREGLAALLRGEGHVVHATDRAADGVEKLATFAPDVVVTDWRLPDGRADELLRRASVPVLVMSGCPAEVDREAACDVLAKPVSFEDLLARIAGLEPTEPPRDRPCAADPLDFLPPDTRARVRLGLVLLNEPASVADDGETVLLQARLPEESVLDALEQLGGDLRVLDDGRGPRVEWRLHRDGRPHGVEVVIGPRDPWPASGSFAIDLDRDRGLSPFEFEDLCARVRRAREEEGREAWLLHVPDHLRLWLEVSGREADLPKRPVSGPRLPEVLELLWSADSLT